MVDWRTRLRRPTTPSQPLMTGMSTSHHVVYPTSPPPRMERPTERPRDGPDYVPQDASRPADVQYHAVAAPGDRQTLDHQNGHTQPSNPSLRYSASHGAFPRVASAASDRSSDAKASRCNSLPKNHSARQFMAHQQSTDHAAKDVHVSHREPQQQSTRASSPPSRDPSESRQTVTNHADHHQTRKQIRTNPDSQTTSVHPHDRHEDTHSPERHPRANHRSARHTAATSAEHTPSPGSPLLSRASATSSPVVRKTNSDRVNDVHAAPRVRHQQRHSPPGPVSTPAAPSVTPSSAVAHPGMTRHHRRQAAPDVSTDDVQPGAFYIANGTAKRASAYLRPAEAAQLRRHKALDALALVKSLPCSVQGWVLVKRDSTRIASLFRSPWLTMWAELRGGMILLFAKDDDEWDASESDTGGIYTSPASSSLSNVFESPPTSLGQQQQYHIPHPTRHDAAFSGSVGGRSTESRSGAQGLSSLGGRYASSGSSGIRRTQSSHRSVGSSSSKREVRIVFVVSNAIFDVKNSKGYSQILLRRPDGVSLVMRVATTAESQEWCVALATATSPYQTVRPSDFIPISPIGRGASGKVFLVRDVRTGDRLALKVIPKQHVFRSSLTFQHVLNERLVLEAMSEEPFLVQLRYSFQSDKHLYLATEFYDGGDVFSLLQTNNGRLAERHACRLVAEVILALDALHKRRIVYRDLKPENVVLDGAGHIRLADFGLAKILEPEESMLTQTICGTTAYAAPEMLQSNAYSLSLDIWCLGIFTYHVLTGRTPYNFKNRTMDEMKEIQRTRPVRYSSSLSPEATSFIRAALQLDPSQRPTITEAKLHPFFRTIDWSSLARKEPHPDNLTSFVSGQAAAAAEAAAAAAAAAGYSSASISSSSGRLGLAPTVPPPASAAAVPQPVVPVPVAAAQPVAPVDSGSALAPQSGQVPPVSGSTGSHVVTPNAWPGVPPMHLSPVSTSLSGVVVGDAVHAPDAAAPDSNGAQVEHAQASQGSHALPALGATRYTGQEPGSSLRTMSSGAAVGPEIADCSAGDDSSTLDHYLLRNINQDEWRNVSFSDDGEDVVTLTRQFPTMLSQTAKQVETEAIAGWAWTNSIAGVDQRDSSSGQLNQHGSQGALEPPAPLLGRQSLPERRRRSLVRRRSLEHPKNGTRSVFDVGPDLDPTAMGAGPGSGLARRMSVGGRDPAQGTDEPAVQRPAPAPMGGRRSLDGITSRRNHSSSRMSSTDSARPRYFGKSPSFVAGGSSTRPFSRRMSRDSHPDEARGGQAAGGRGLRRREDAQRVSAPPGAYTGSVATAGLGDSSRAPKREDARGGWRHAERITTGDSDRIRANLYADPMNPDPCRDDPSDMRQGGRLLWRDRLFNKRRF